MSMSKSEFFDILRDYASLEFADLPQSNSEIDYEFSPQFKRKMKRLFNQIDKQDFADRKKVNNLKVIKIKKIILIAALIAISFSVAITIGAKYFNIDASDKIVNYDGDWFNLDLKEGKTDAKKHSDDSIDIVKRIKELGIDEVILPSLLLSDEYEKDIHDIQDEEYSITIVVNLTNKTTNITGYFDLIKYKSPEFLFNIGKSEVPDDYDSVKQLTINGMDIMVFSNEKMSYILYIDNDVTYSIWLKNCSLDSAIEIANSLEQ